VIFYWQLNFMDKKFAVRRSLYKTGISSFLDSGIYKPDV
jgi:hypothetical protein